MLDERASLLDIIPIVVIITAVGISVIFAHLVLDEFDKGFNYENRTETFNQTIDRTEKTLESYDYLLVFVLGGLMISTIMLAFFIPSHPALFAISFIMLAVILTIGGIYSNVFVKVVNASALQSSTNQFPVLYQTMKNLPLIILGFSAVLAIVMYSSGGQKRV